jgi:hypothetical protein
MSMSMPKAGAVHAGTPPNHGPSVRAQILATEHWSLLATRNVLASTAMFITVVNAIVAGALASLIALAADAPAWLIAVIGAVTGLAYVSTVIAMGRRSFSPDRLYNRFPSTQSARKE